MVSKKDFIDNSIIRELKEKYPNVENDNNVSYKVKLEYLTFEIDFITDPLITYLVDEYGVVVIGLIHFLRSKMCFNGWCVRVDGFYLNQLLKECSNLFNTTKEELKKVYDELIENDFFYEVSDSSITKGTYLTCIQQIFNYEMAASQRKRERDKKARQREAQREENKQQTTIKEQEVKQKEEEINVIDEMVKESEVIEPKELLSPEELYFEELANKFFDDNNVDDESNYF